MKRTEQLLLSPIDPFTPRYQAYPVASADRDLEYQNVLGQQGYDCLDLTGIEQLYTHNEDGERIPLTEKIFWFRKGQNLLGEEVATGRCVFGFFEGIPKDWYEKDFDLTFFDTRFNELSKDNCPDEKHFYWWQLALNIKKLAFMYRPHELNLAPITFNFLKREYCLHRKGL